MSRDGLAVHWEGEGRIARRDHAQCAQQVEDIREFHKTHGYNDIAYSHLACVHGSVFEGRGWDALSAATCNGSYNRRYWAICAMIGTLDVVTPELKRAIRAHAGEARRRGASSFICHSDACATACPGDELCAWVHAGMPVDEEPEPEPPPRWEDDDMSETLATWTADNEGGEWHFATCAEYGGDLWHHWGPGGHFREVLAGPAGATFGVPVTAPIRKVTRQLGAGGPQRVDLFMEFIGDLRVGHLWRPTNEWPWAFEYVE